MSQKALLIAEKPDLQRKIEEVYKNHRNSIPYEITFAAQRGHLVTLLSPTEMDESLSKWEWDTLPIEPEQYGGWKYKVIEEPKKGNFMTAKERYAAIAKAIRSGSYDFIIHAGDADQEGELLVNIVLRSIGNKLPVKRFWTNDLTESHILNALTDLRDDDNDPMLTNLMAAAVARQHSDWRFGMNVSRAATLKMRNRISCGRVKTPILAVVCKREEEIRNFRPSTTYGVKAVYDEGFEGTLYDEKEAEPEDSKKENDDEQKNGVIWMDTREEAETVMNDLHETVTVISCSSKNTETYAPKLYKLATAQIDAGKKGYNDKDTLDTIQKLYEKEYLSYPRTDCEYLSSDEDFSGILNSLSGISDYDEFTKNIDELAIEKVRHNKRWINDKALQEAGHSALRPTTNVPDPGELSQIERDIYDMIVRRFIAIFLPPQVQKRTVLIGESNGHTFRSSGKELTDPGFSVIFGTKFTDTKIPEHSRGDILDVDKYEITEKTTTCPKRYTSPELISVCENPQKFINDPALKAITKSLKIGTPATRSEIINQLIIKDKYMEVPGNKKNGQIKPTELGEAIIENLAGLMICRVDMTAEWEESLSLVRKGEKSLKEIEGEMKQSVREMLAEIKDRDMKRVGEKDKTVAGKCPVCGRDVYESDNGFYCSGWGQGCKTGIFKKAMGCDFDFNDYVTLASGNEVEKDGRTFYYDKETNKVTEKGTVSAIICPACSAEHLTETPTRYFCKCGFSTYKEIAGHRITQEELNKIAEDGHTDIIDNFVSSKSGKRFSAQLVMTDKKIEFKFDNGPTSDTGNKCPCCKKDTIKQQGKKCVCSCGFSFWTTVAGKDLSRKDVEDLCRNGETKMYDDWKGKKGAFTAKLAVNKKKKSTEFKFEDLGKEADLETLKKVFGDKSPEELIRGLTH